MPASRVRSDTPVSSGVPGFAHHAERAPGLAQGFSSAPHRSRARSGSAPCRASFDLAGLVDGSRQSSRSGIIRCFSPPWLDLPLPGGPMNWLIPVNPSACVSASPRKSFARISLIPVARHGGVEPLGVEAVLHHQQPAADAQRLRRVPGSQSAFRVRRPDGHGVQPPRGQAGRRRQP